MAAIDLADSSLVQLCHVTYVVERGTNRLGLWEKINKSGPKLALFYRCVRSTCAQLLAYAEWKRAQPFSALIVLLSPVLT